MTIDRLWAKYQEERTDEHRNAIVLHYLPLARIVARSERKRLGGSFVSEDELFGAASVGLIAAVENFVPQRNLKFKTFSSHRLRGAIRDWLRQVDPLPRTARKFLQQKNHAEEILMSSELLGENSLAETMGISDEYYAKWDRYTSRKTVLVSSLSKHDRGYCDVADAKNTDPTRLIAQDMLRELINKNFRRIERMVLILYYFENLTLQEIADMLERTESRISQVKVRATKKFVKYFKKEYV